MWHQSEAPLLDGLYDPATGLPDALGAVVQALLDAQADGRTVHVLVTVV